ncbi:DUF4124 domain-containing protein [uncultured Ramlibacter sp.]|uniref:DUF4124 domain-containing protein n=1 Tax=uncultured Ramlibacter sp. TaxID=260755 RepID=UPI00260C6990|nr:DUF4124 domain-containing protein [uncultured Ramlibacter sp.]
MNRFRALTLALGCALPLAAAAQWVWLDKDGRKVYSDQSPPASIPAKSILKQPGGKAMQPPEATPAAEAPAGAVAAASAPKVAASGLKVSGTDKALEEKKKQADAAEATKKQAEAERVSKIKAENCERAKRSKASFDSGVRIAYTNAKGERDIMDDAMRASEAKRLDGIIATDCKAPG